jgi:hypothetical protein
MINKHIKICHLAIKKMITENILNVQNVIKIVQLVYFQKNLTKLNQITLFVRNVQKTLRKYESGEKKYF